MRRILVTCVLVMGLLLGVVSLASAWPWAGKDDAAGPVVQEAVQEPVQAKASAKPVVKERKAPAPPPAVVPVKKKKVGAVKAAPVRSAVDQKALARKRALKDKKRKAIDGNRWEISMMAMSGKGEKMMDVLIFEDNKFSSRDYAGKGYAPSNYTVSLTDDGRAVVETMQSDDVMGICFWRVEFDDQLAGFNGVLSRQISENKTDDYSFKSSAKNPIVN